MSRIKSWSAQIEKCNTKADKLRRQLAQVEKELAYNERKSRELQGKIDLLNSQEVVISPHCLQRYRERFDENASEEDCRKALITEDLLFWLSVLSEGEFPVDMDSNIKLIIKDRTVVTVY